MFFRKKFKITNVSPRVVAFYYSQYAEVMKGGTDKTDKKLKKHLYDIILGLGVPVDDEEELEEVPPLEIEHNETESIPHINRRRILS